MPRDYGRYLETKAGPETTAQHQRNKFSNMNSSPMKTNPKTRTFNPYASERDYSFGYAGNTEEYNKALALRGTFENTAKQFQARAAKKDEKAHVLSSFSQSMYRNPGTVRAEVQKYQPFHFQTIFEQYTSSTSPDCQVDISHVEDIVKGVMGSDTPQWILSKFRRLAGDVSQFRLISWDQFREIVPMAQEVTELECEIKKAEIPEFLRPQTAAAFTSSSRGGLVPYQSKSSYMCDYDITRLDDDAMIGMPPKDNSTTRDMFLGTTKATEHPPRYCGHIPQNTYNLRKEEHSSGRTHRPQTSYLRLASERLGCVPNYTGYIPKHTGLESDRVTGMDPRTTTGAAYGRFP